MLEGTIDFYRQGIASSSLPLGKSTVRKIYPLTRGEFAFGSTVASFYLIKKIALSCFYLLGSLFERPRASFVQNVHAIPKTLAASMCGLLGTIIPQTVNEKLLGIPVGGLNISGKVYQNLTFSSFSTLLS